MITMNLKALTAGETSRGYSGTEDELTTIARQPECQPGK